MTEDSSQKISNPESISRLMGTMCDGGMPILIRHQDSGKVTIRGALVKIGRYRQTPVVLLGKISELGLTRVDIGTHLKVEVLGMSTQLTFITMVLEKARDGMICAMPRTLLSTERRHSTRHKITPMLTAFMSFDFWRPQSEDLTSPPVLEAYRGMSSWLPIADVSSGGVCLITRFPAFVAALEGVSDTPVGFLHLPMSAPLPIQTALRWKRKIKNRFDDEGLERYQLEFRVGVEFLEQTEDQVQRIKQFIRQLTIAEAI